MKFERDIDLPADAACWTATPLDVQTLGLIAAY